MSNCQVYLHYVWATKYRTQFLPTTEIREHVWAHITANAKKKKINVLWTSGYQDHCHCLMLMPKDQTLSKIAQLLKGESSHWINETRLLKPFFPKVEFEWQRQYFVKSVCTVHVQSTLEYLTDQELHHANNPIEDEFDQFLVD